MTEWIKAALNGLFAIFVSFLLLTIYVILIQKAPFFLPAVKMPHTADTVYQLEVTNILFIYGIFWSIVLVLLFGNKVSTLKGLGLGVVLWLFMMVVYSPIAGWGFFGFHGQEVPSQVEHMIVNSPWAFLLVTLVLHVVYGAIIGAMNAKWIDFNKLSMPDSLKTPK